MARRDVVVTFLRASGPGGQHRNKTETGVRLLHVPTGIVVTATERRSRRQNLDVAFERLERKLAELRKPKKKRVATKPTRASRERRLQEKKKRGETKRQRRSPPPD
ncbi:MAG: peptide chain release factor-like protein [Planctomycetota bacterium]|jgi:protein subunit release factor B